MQTAIKTWVDGWLAKLPPDTVYNAASAGPIRIADGITVTVADNATWSIH